jgi:dTDP-D-glucose 4,6-dehydratase
MKIIITGTAGFIGQAVCRHPPRETNAEFARRPEVVAS